MLTENSVVYIFISLCVCHGVNIPNGKGPYIAEPCSFTFD